MHFSPASCAGLALLFLFGCGTEEKVAALENTPELTPPSVAAEDDHVHNEEPLGSITLGEHTVELKQGHESVEPGKESHLVVKLPYNDAGATVVRAWIGTEDRTLSYVGKGEYAPSHDDYDIHATAPDPLPENPMWWVEIVKPDGTKLSASIKPL